MSRIEIKYISDKNDFALELERLLKEVPKPEKLDIFYCTISNESIKKSIPFQA